MARVRPRWEEYSAVLVFAVSGLLLWLRFGHWFYLSIDEGISLEGARLVARGEVPYRDFFVLTGPGSFWLYGAAFHFFGTSLAVARAVLCGELALLCALICWFARQVAGTALAIASAFLFLAVLLTTFYPIYSTHRWDSNALALLAAALAWKGWQQGRSAGWLAASGMCAGMAVCFTPPMVLVALVLVVFCGGARRWFAAGFAVPCAVAAAVLTAQGAWGDLVGAIGWDAAHYAGANRLGYGALAGAAARGLIAGVDSWAPVLLPPLAFAVGLVALLKKGAERRFFWFAGAVAAASLAACSPRFGAAQLLFVSAFFWVLLTCAAGVLLAGRSRAAVAGLMLALAAGAGYAGWPGEELKRMETPAGELRVSKRTFVQLNDLLSAVKPGESAFVYPYLPALYFVLDVRNPTRYSFLQPGMMGPGDEAAALAGLRANPPRWIVWHDFSEAFILKNWPGSDRGRLHFAEMENYFRDEYHAVDPDGVVPIGYRLLERNR